MDKTRLTYQLTKVMGESNLDLRAQSKDNEIIKPVSFFYKDESVTINLARSSAVFDLTDEDFINEFSTELDELENLYLKARAEGKEGLERDVIKPYALKIHEMEGKDHSFPPYHMFIDLAKKNEQIEERFWQLIENIFNEAGRRYVASVEKAKEETNAPPTSGIKRSVLDEKKNSTFIGNTGGLEIPVQPARSQQEFERMIQIWNNAKYVKAEDIKTTSLFIENNWSRLKIDEASQISIASQAYSELVDAGGLDEVRKASKILEKTQSGREVNKNYNESINQLRRIIESQDKMLKSDAK